MSRTPLAVTFVLPAIGGAGGVRTTIRMANELAHRGHSTRIAAPQAPWWQRLRSRARGDFTWESSIRIPLVRYRELGRVPWRPEEIVVAVGSHTVAAVADPAVQVACKVAWCKGFTENQPELMRTAWSSAIPKIAVSPTLVEPLKKYGGAGVLGVAPNGVDLHEYQIIPDLPRDGVGLIFSRHWKKDPEFTEAVLAALEARYPEVPVRVFGLERRGPTLLRGTYHRSPPVALAREIYNRSLAWLITSRSEGFCNPMLEAMACGAVVVSTHHASAPGLIDHEKNGLLVPLGDLDGFVTSVGRVLDDARLRAKLQQGGFDTIPGFSWNAAAEAMERCLHTVLAQADNTEIRP